MRNLAHIAGIAAASSSAAAAAAALAASRSCLSGTFLKVSPQTFRDLEPDLIVIVHRILSRSRHIYFGSTKDHIVFYCYSDTYFGVRVDIEAVGISKAVNL